MTVRDFLKRPDIRTILVIIAIIVLIITSWYSWYYFIRVPSVSPDTMTIAELLSRGKAGTNVTIYGQRTFMFGDHYMCPCFDIVSGTRKIHIWTNLLYPDLAFQADTNKTEDGDWILVYGYYSREGGEPQIRAWRIEKL